MSNRNILLAAAGVSTGNPNAWDISKAYYDAGSDAGDVSKYIYSSATNLNGQMSNGAPTGVAISPDGLKMYAISATGTGDDTVYQYETTTPWSGWTYASKSFSIGSQEPSPTALSFKSDGTKMYVIGTGADTVFQYSLATAWDVSTASYDSVSFSVASQETSPQGLTFKPDGTKMYVTGWTGVDVNEYDLSTAWDISSASYVQIFSVSSQDPNPTGVSFLEDGTKMYVTGIGTGVGRIYQYSLSTAWDVSSASFTQTQTLSSLTQWAADCVMQSSGNQFVVLSSIDNTGAGVAYVLSFLIGGFSVAAEETNPNGISFKADGTKMYIIGTTGDDVNEYDLSTAWDISTASYVQNFSVAGQDTSPTGMFFKPDGTKMYMCGNAGDDVNEYSLSVAWDISSASYVQNFSISSQETVPQDLFFSSDGTKMYICGNTLFVHEYDLSTAWDISTASYLQEFSVAAQEGSAPIAISFKSDGTAMYVNGAASRNVIQYSLATPWSVTTASYVQAFNVQAQDTNPAGLFWSDDGDKFFIAGVTNDRVYKFSISPE